MSEYTHRLNKIVKILKDKTSLKCEKQLMKVATAVDDFAQFILSCYKGKEGK